MNGDCAKAVLAMVKRSPWCLIAGGLWSQLCSDRQNEAKLPDMWEFEIRRGEGRRFNANRWRQTCAESWQFDRVLALFRIIAVAGDAAKTLNSCWVILRSPLTAPDGPPAHTHARKALHVLNVMRIYMCVRENNASSFIIGEGRLLAPFVLFMIEGFVFFCSDWTQANIGRVCGNS